MKNLFKTYLGDILFTILVLLMNYQWHIQWRIATTFGIEVFLILLVLSVLFALLSFIRIIRVVKFRKRQVIRYWAHFSYGMLATISQACVVYGSRTSLAIADLTFFLLLVSILGFTIARASVWLHKRHQAKRKPPTE